MSLPPFPSHCPVFAVSSESTIILILPRHSLRKPSTCSQSLSNPLVSPFRILFESLLRGRLRAQCIVGLVVFVQNTGRLHVLLYPKSRVLLRRSVEKRVTIKSIHCKRFYKMYNHIIKSATVLRLDGCYVTLVGFFVVDRYS